MGFFSSSSRSTTNAPTTGSQTSNAPSTALNVSGNRSNQNIYVTNTQTDHGAIEFMGEWTGDALFAFEEMARNNADMAASIARDGLDAGTSIARDGIDAGTMIARDGIDANVRVTETAIYESGNSLRDIIGFGQGILDGAAGLVRDAMQEASFQTANALATAEAGVAAGQAMTRDAIDSNNMITKDSLMLSQSVVNLTDDLYAESAGFLRGTMTDFTDTVVRLDDSRNKESAQTLDAITELATVVQTGGESINANVNKMIAGIAIVTAGAIAWRALG